MFKTNQIVSFSQILIDLVAINISFGIANIVVFSHFWVDGWAYPSLFIVMNISVLISYYYTKQQEINPSFNIFAILKYAFKLNLFIIIIVSSYWIIVNSEKYYLVHLIFFFTLNLILLIIFKFSWNLILQKILFQLYNTKNVLIITNSNDGLLNNTLSKNKWLKYNIIDNLTYQSNLDDLSLYINQLNIQLLIFNFKKELIRKNDFDILNNLENERNINIYFIANSKNENSIKIIDNITLEKYN